MKNIGRNDPCPCNSGKKYKKCCGPQETPAANPASSSISIPNALQTALAHHQAGRLAQAESIYQHILQIEPNHPDALHLLGLIAYQIGNSAIAIELYRKAINIRSNFVQAYNNLGIALREQGKLNEAIASYKQALTLKPDYAEAHYNLGDTLYAYGKPDEAIGCYRQALSLKPDYAEAYNNLGNVFQDQGKLDEAVASYQQALRLQPDYAEAYSNLGLTRQAQEKLGDAVVCYRQALSLRPDSAETHYNLGNAFRELGKPDDAIACYHKALSIKPDYAEAYSNLGLVCQHQGKTDEAVANYEQALKLKPESAELYYNLGNALRELKKLDEAVASYRRALTIKPDYAEAQCNLGVARQNQGRADEAVACFEQALKLKPDYAEAYNNLGISLNDQGEPDAAIACYRQALTIKPDYVEAHSNLLFFLNYHPDMSAEAIFAEYRRWNDLHARPLLPSVVTHANARNPDRRLRIGYVSPHLHKHSARHFIEPLLALHDKTQVEIFAYAQVTVEDDVSARLREYTDHWTNTAGMSDDTMAETIRRDGIDILVDLAGHNANNRLLVFARKPAPVQVSWMGYGYTTGLETMDYFLSDREFTPPGSEPLFSEKLVRLPVAGVYRPAEGMGEPGPLPALKAGIVTLGSLSRSIRINYRVVRTWAAILHRLPNSRLMINSLNFRGDGMQQGLRNQFSAHGIAPDRLVLGFQSPPWDVLRRIDISLDCFPHNSGTTLWEGLYMGTPAITLAGRPSVGRSGALALKAINHPEWIAESEQEYIDKLAALASDLDALAALRAGLRGRMKASLLMDEPAFVRSLETAYRTMWQRWCNGLAPANIGK